MALISTPAIVLHAFKYGETSKIVRLATREHGLQSAIAKGASRPRSRFGAQLQSLSQGTAQLYLKPQRELQTLAAFDVTTQRGSLAADMQRYAAAQVVAELMLRCAPAEPQAVLFDHVAHMLDRLGDVGPERVGAAGLAAVWRLVVLFGFTPLLTSCARDGRALGTGAAAFSVADGGFVCSSCADGRQSSTLAAGDRDALAQLVAGSDEIDGGLSARHGAAHRRLLARFIRHHLAEHRDLKALDFWEAMPWPGTS